MYDCNLVRDTRIRSLVIPKKTNIKSFEYGFKIEF